MPTRPVPTRRFAALAAAVALLAIPASSQATICPSGTVGPPASVYCVATGGTFFRDVTRSYNPAAYFRLGDGTGASVMAGDNGLPDGEYKNGQDSGPIGIADDGDTARSFFGVNGYGYANGIEAPNYHGSVPYGNYTMEAWVYQPTTVHDGTIVEFGRAGSLYISGGKIYFKNGDDVTAPGYTIAPDHWYMVVGVMSNTTMRLFVQQSPGTPTPFVSTPVATGHSNYRPEGSPTFYVSYGDLSGASFLSGYLDEVVYVKRNLSVSELAAQFYADPAPDPSTLVAPAVPASTTPATTGPFSDNSSTPPVKQTTHKPAPKPVSKLAAAKIRVKALTHALAVARITLQHLQFSHAPKKQIAQAKAAVKDISRQLAKAKAQVKKLTPKPKHTAKPKHPAPKKH